MAGNKLQSISYSFRKKSYETAKFFKIHKVSLDTNMKQNIQTSKTFFEEIVNHVSLLLKKKKKKKARKVRTCWYRGLSSDLLIPY